MNKHILELAQQVGLISSFNAAPHRPDIEKFAQLIVEKCASIAAEGPCYAGLAASEMKNHFGIEQ